MSIEIRNITRRFGTFVAVDDVSFTVPTGELVALLGPSGSGKTSLLRVIAGLEEPDRGQVLFAGQDATGRDARQRGVGFVFQHYALFRHMTVFENVAFGLRVRPRNTRPKESELRSRVMDLLRLVQLDWLFDRYPQQLSGGQRQRVALARALAVEPKVLLLDEPFGSLDARVRRELRRWLRRLHDEIHVTSVFVTHDQEEALEVSDRIVLINRGRVEQIGTPAEVVEAPATRFVMSFLGAVNELPQGLVRPYDIDLSRHEAGGGFWATVSHIAPAGALVRIELAAPEAAAVHVEMARERSSTLAPETGERLYVKPREVREFRGEALAAGGKAAGAG